MPTRILRDGIIESERVNALSFESEVLYRRLMSKVDDFGRFHGNPALIRAACYPLQLERVSLDDIVRWLSECTIAPLASGSTVPLITAYEVDGKKYIQVNEFGQRTRTASKFPPPNVRDLRSNVRNMPQPAAICGNPPQPAAQSESESESYAESETKAVIEIGSSAERMYALHPKKKNFPLVIVALDAATNTAGFPGLSLVEECHAAWSKTHEWNERNGNFAPKLDEWISDRGYTKWPAGHARDPTAANAKPLKVDRRDMVTILAAQEAQEKEDWRIWREQQEQI